MPKHRAVFQFSDVFRSSKEIRRNDGCHPLSPTVGFAAPQETLWPPQASGQKDPQMTRAANDTVLFLGGGFKDFFTLT